MSFLFFIFSCLLSLSLLVIAYPQIVYKTKIDSKYLHTQGFKKKKGTLVFFDYKKQSYTNKKIKIKIKLQSYHSYRQQIKVRIKNENKSSNRRSRGV